MYTGTQIGLVNHVTAQKKLRHETLPDKRR